MNEFDIISAVAIVLSCLLLGVLYKTRQRPQRAAVWAGPILMIALASMHLYTGGGVLNFLAVSVMGFIFFFAWAYAYLGHDSFVHGSNTGLLIAVIFSLVLLPWFFLYLAANIYIESRGSARQGERVKKVWKEASGSGAPSPSQGSDEVPAPVP